MMNISIKLVKWRINGTYFNWLDLILYVFSFLGTCFLNFKNIPFQFPDIFGITLNFRIQLVNVFEESKILFFISLEFGDDVLQVSVTCNCPDPLQGFFVCVQLLALDTQVFLFYKVEWIRKRKDKSTSNNFLGASIWFHETRFNYSCY